MLWRECVARRQMPTAVQHRLSPLPRPWPPVVAGHAARRCPRGLLTAISFPGREPRVGYADLEAAAHRAVAACELAWAERRHCRAAELPAGLASCTAALSLCAEALTADLRDDPRSGSRWEAWAAEEPCAHACRAVDTVATAAALDPLDAALAMLRGAPELCHEPPARVVQAVLDLRIRAPPVANVAHLVLEEPQLLLSGRRRC